MADEDPWVDKVDEHLEWLDGQIKRHQKGITVLAGGVVLVGLSAMATARITVQLVKGMQGITQVLNSLVGAQQVQAPRPMPAAPQVHVQPSHGTGYDPGPQEVSPQVKEELADWKDMDSILSDEGL